MILIWGISVLILSGRSNSMYKKTAREKIVGCMIAIPTIFDDKSELDSESMKRHVMWLIECGAREGNSYILAGAATGEFASMNADERIRLASAVVEAADGRIPVIVGAQSTNWRESRDIAKHCIEIGATGIQLSPTYYYSPSDDDVFEYFHRASEELDIGIAVYNTWWMGFHINLDLLGRLIELEKVAVIKWSAPDWLEWNKGYRLYSSKITMVNNHLDHVGAVFHGATSVNCHPCIYWPEWGITLWDHLSKRRWNEAQTMLTEHLYPFYDIYFAAIKEFGGEGHLDKVALDLIGLKGGLPRHPVRPLSQKYYQMMEDFFRKTGTPFPRQ